jgi:hypothetical protein
MLLLLIRLENTMNLVIPGLTRNPAQAATAGSKQRVSNAAGCGLSPV